MTESEARGKIKYRIATAMSLVGTGEDGKAYEDLEIALQVMKEIREYRELGTVEELKALKEKNEPKKVIEYAPHENKAKCPQCNSWLEAHSSKVFCCYCGRKLDWE